MLVALVLLCEVQWWLSVVVASCAVVACRCSCCIVCGDILWARSAFVCDRRSACVTCPCRRKRVCVSRESRLLLCPMAVSASLTTSKRALLDEELAEVTERLKRLKLSAPEPERVDWTRGKDDRVWQGTWLQITICDSDVPMAVEQLAFKRLQ